MVAKPRSTSPLARGSSRNQRRGLGDEVVDRGRRRLRLRGQRPARQRRDPFRLRVRLRDRGAQPRAPQHQHEAMLPHRLDEQLQPRDADAAQPLHDGGGLLAGEAAGAAVADRAIAGQGAEVAPRGDVAGLQREADPGRLQHAAADVELQGVVAEQRQVTRAGARRDPVAHGHRQPQRALAGQRVEVRCVGGLQLRQSAIGVRQAAQAVQHQPEDLAVGGAMQAPGEVEVHLVPPPAAAPPRRS